MQTGWATRHRIVGGLSLAITPSPHPWVGGIVRVGGPLLFDHPPCNIFMGTNKRYPCMQGGNLGGNNSYSCKLTNHPSNQSHCPPRLPGYYMRALPQSNLNKQSNNNLKGGGLPYYYKGPPSRIVGLEPSNQAISPSTFSLKEDGHHYLCSIAPTPKQWNKQ